MAGRWIFAVTVCFLASAEHVFTEEIINTGEIQDDNILPDEVRFQDGYSTRITFAHLKTSLVQLGFNVDRHGTSKAAPKLDFVFVMDNSGSIGSSDFNLEKRFVENLIEYFPIFPEKTRVAVVTYATYVKLEFNFNKYINKKCLRKGIQAIKYTGGWTATGTALRYVYNSLIDNIAAGARKGVKKVVFVITDGRSNRGVNPATPARHLKRDGVIIFALGVTNNIRQSELRAIATDSSHVFRVTNYAALNAVTKKIKGDISTKCYTGQTVYDACGRRCKCRSGKLVDCCRLRKEFTDMTKEERVRYINTVKTASTATAYKATYDKLLTIHKNVFDSKIHRVDFFLPWHRWFILQYENLLRQVDCRVTVPYWDWSLVGASPFLSDVWNTGSHGFGGNGVPRRRCVKTGPFRSAVWRLPASAGGRCLRRDFSGRFPDAAVVRSLLTTSAAKFSDFEDQLRVTFHDDIHCKIDGTMCTRDSASAPEFFLHHGFVDKIWSDWQKRSNAHKFNTYFRNHRSIMPSTPYRARELLDLSNQPGCVCVEYVDPRSSTYSSLKGMSTFALASIPRLSLPPLSSKAIKLFGLSKAQLRVSLNLRAKLEPTHVIPKSSLHGKYVSLGIDLSKIPKDLVLFGDEENDDE